MLFTHAVLIWEVFRKGINPVRDEITRLICSVVKERRKQFRCAYLDVAIGLAAVALAMSTAGRQRVNEDWR